VQILAQDAPEVLFGAARCGAVIVGGLKLPRVSLGLWQNFGSVNAYDNAREMCLVAFDHGITHFDLANNCIARIACFVKAHIDSFSVIRKKERTHGILSFSFFV